MIPTRVYTEPCYWYIVSLEINASPVRLLTPSQICDLILIVCQIISKIIYKLSNLRTTHYKVRMPINRLTDLINRMYFCLCIIDSDRRIGFTNFIKPYRYGTSNIVINLMIILSQSISSKLTYISYSIKCIFRGKFNPKFKKRKEKEIHFKLINVSWCHVNIPRWRIDFIIAPLYLYLRRTPGPVMQGRTAPRPVLGEGITLGVALRSRQGRGPMPYCVAYTSNQSVFSSLETHFLCSSCANFITPTFVLCFSVSLASLLFGIWLTFLQTAILCRQRALNCRANNGLFFQLISSQMWRSVHRSCLDIHQEFLLYG